MSLSLFDNMDRIQRIISSNSSERSLRFFNRLRGKRVEYQVIYWWKSKLCHDECYLGRTTHARTNERTSRLLQLRRKRVALSMHEKEGHDSGFNLKNPYISIVKKVSPRSIRREEFIHITH